MDQPSDVGAEMFVFVGLSVCCVFLVLYEVLKRIELTVDKLIALGIGGLFVLAVSVAAWLCRDPTMFLSAIGMVAIPLGLILLGDELGEMTGIRIGLVSKTTPGCFPSLFGWVFLMVIIAVFAYDIGSWILQ